MCVRCLVYVASTRHLKTLSDNLGQSKTLRNLTIEIHFESNPLGALQKSTARRSPSSTAYEVLSLGSKTSRTGVPFFSSCFIDAKGANATILGKTLHDNFTRICAIPSILTGFYSTEAYRVHLVTSYAVMYPMSVWKVRKRQCRRRNGSLPAYK